MTSILFKAETGIIIIIALGKLVFLIESIKVSKPNLSTSKKVVCAK